MHPQKRVLQRGPLYLYLTTIQCLDEHFSTEVVSKVQFDYNTIQIYLQNESALKCITCKKELEVEDAKKFLSKKNYEKYDDLTFKLYIRRQPYFRWCAHTCGSGQVGTII